MEEVWKDAPGFDYRVNNKGVVVNSSGKVIKDRPKNKTSKYRRINLCKDGKKYSFSVHRLVWEAFNGPIPEGMQVNHIDENPENNSLDNLNLMTPEENSNYGSRNQKIRELQTGENNSFYGKHPSDYCKQRSRETHSKPVLQYSKEMMLLARYESIEEASKICKIAAPNISGVCNHRRFNKTAGGYKWEFAL